MAIITCDICDKSNVPGSHGQDSTGCDVSACFICQGDEFDPYGEMEEAVFEQGYRLDAIIAELDRSNAQPYSEEWHRLMDAYHAERNRITRGA